MSTVRKTITLTEKQDAWLKSRIDAGDYTNDSEVIRDLIRTAQAQEIMESPEEIAAIRAALQKGLDSGIGTRSFEELWEEGEKRALKQDAQV